MKDIQEQLIENMSNERPNLYFKSPQAIRKWDFLGDGYTFILHSTTEISWWKRFWTSILFRSKWTRI